MALTLRSFATLVSNAVTAAQGACVFLLNLRTGTPGRAILEAVAGVGLWLQYVALVILSRNRLSTSTGDDVDSFIEDFGLTRESGVAATGVVTFTSFSYADTSATILVGALVKTVAGVIYAVTEDTTLSIWSSDAGGYVRAAGVQSITVPVECTSTGTSGNVAAGAICLLGTAISGIDVVTNAAALTNGTDGETDSEVRTRFANWISSLARATLASIIKAVEAVSSDIQCQGVENVDTAGNFYPGNVVLYIDDGSGDVSDAIIAEAYSAADEERAAGVSIQVVRPTILRPTVSLSISVASGANKTGIETTISNNISTYFNDLTIGEGAVYTQLIQIAYAASSSVQSVSNVLLNGGVSDISGENGVAIRAGTVTFV